MAVSFNVSEGSADLSRMFRLPDENTSTPCLPKQGLTRDKVFVAPLAMPRPRPSHTWTTLLTYTVAIAIAVLVALTIGHGLAAEFTRLAAGVP